MVGVAQLVERWLVVPEVAGSSPVVHPNVFDAYWRLPKLRRRSEFATTNTELAAIAAPAIIGFKNPSAAIGMPIAL